MSRVKDLNFLRNIGISAHIDSGKTTLTERILFYTGRISRIHEVKGKDGVGATMDSMDLEREKGITIQSAATYVNWKDYAINIIDTPGHVDFTIEVERALRVLDGAVLVLCAVGGVQSQTITVDRQMRRYNVPCIAFVNKCDRAGADPIRVCQQMRDELQHNAALIQYPIGLESDHKGVVDLIEQKAYYFEGDHGEIVREAEIPAELKDEVEKYREKLIETVADIDDEIAMAYLEGEEISAEDLHNAIAKATQKRQFTPVCMGSAYKNKGVQPLLDAICRYLPSPLQMEYEALDQDRDGAVVQLDPSPEKPLVMLAFKLEDGRYGQLTYCRIYQGRLKKGDFIYNVKTGKKHKVSRFGLMHADQMHEIEEADAGDIVALFGIDCTSGDTFTDGTVRYTMTSMYVPEPVVTLAVNPKKRESSSNFSKALQRFAKEDPTFRVYRDEETGETLIGGMGELQLEVYIERIRREYNVEVEVGAPKVAYRETITRRADFMYTHKKQTGGAGQFAKVGGYIEPTEGDSKYEFVNQIVGGIIPKEFIPSCDKGFQTAMEKGTLIGAPVIGVRVVLNDGATHPVDSSDLAFQIAARGAFREAYPRANPIILEPVMKVVVEAPEEFSGAVLSTLNRRRGIIVGNLVKFGTTVVEAEVPLSEMFGYSNELRSVTQGKGEFTMEFKKYSPVPAQLQEKLIEEKKKKDKENKK